MAEGWDSMHFVERKDTMEWLKKKYTTRGSQVHQYRIYGIHGKKGIGKSCLMQKFLQQIQQDSSRNQKVHVGSFDFDKIKSFQSFLNILCKFYGVKKHTSREHSGYGDDDEEEEDFTDCMSDIETKMTFEPGNTYIVFLDNMECACGKAKTDGTAPDKSKTFLWDRIYKEFIHYILPKCSNLLVFITSTQTAKFAEFSRIACNKDLTEMTEEEGKCLLRGVIARNRGSGVIENEESLSSIISLCDGLPPTILKAGDMLCDGEYRVEEIAELLEDFDYTMNVHGDDLYPKADRYDEQLKLFINRLSNDNRTNLRSLAVMIHDKMGAVGLEEAIARLQFETNTAVFKLRFLLPLRFRGMVEVDTTEGKINMNKFFRQFVMRHIKGNEDVVQPRHGHSPTSGAQISPQRHNKHRSDDDQSPSANHLIVPSHNSQDKSTFLLEDKSGHDNTVNQYPAVQHVTVPSQFTQDIDLLDTQSVSEKPEPNIAKMEGPYFGNREEKPRYDIALTNLGSGETADGLMRENYLSPDETNNGKIPRNIARPNTGNNLTPVNQPIPIDGTSKSSVLSFSSNERTSELGNDNKNMSESSGEGNDENEQNACRKKRSNTLEENTTITCKNQKDKYMQSHMSVEENYLQSFSSVNTHGNIPEKKLNRRGSFDDNSLQEHPDPKSERSVSPISTVTEDDNVSETLLKYCDTDSTVSGNITALSWDHQSGITDVSQHMLPFQQYHAMSHLGLRDYSTTYSTTNNEEPTADDSLNCSISSDRLFASGRDNCLGSVRDVGQDQCPEPESLGMVAGTRESDGRTLIRKLDSEADSVDTTALYTMPTFTPGYGCQESETSQRTPQLHSPQTGVQGLSPLGGDRGTTPLREPLTGHPVRNESGSTSNGSSITEPRSHLNDHVETAVRQEGSGVFASVYRFCTGIYQSFKNMES